VSWVPCATPVKPLRKLEWSSLFAFDNRLKNDIYKSMTSQPNPSQALAACLTRAASRQTYYTIRFLADQDRRMAAYEAYAYFRWVDDVLDEQAGTPVEKAAFIQRQVDLLEACSHGQMPAGLTNEERMLADLLERDHQPGSGLQAYLTNMMAVLTFDASRRGQVVSQAQLEQYTSQLALAVTEALHYFIGHEQPAPLHPDRYLAVSAAHITHMLRDFTEDLQTGYFNLPGEWLKAKKLQPGTVHAADIRDWVCERVKTARDYFQAGRRLLAGDPCLRRRLAGCAYLARFEWMLERIEQDTYTLCDSYPARKSLPAALWMVIHTLESFFINPARLGHPNQTKPTRPVSQP